MALFRKEPEKSAHPEHPHTGTPQAALAPQINLSPNPVAIGYVCKGSTCVGQLEVSDTGADKMPISSITKTSGSADVSLASGPTFPVNVSPDANFIFTFDCTPTTFGAKSATFNIASNDPANPNTAVTVMCNTAAGAIDVAGTGNLGTANCSGSTPPQTLQINNVGNCTLNLASAIISCADFTLVNPGELPAAISPDSSLPVGVNFTPHPRDQGRATSRLPPTTRSLLWSLFRSPRIRLWVPRRWHSRRDSRSHRL